MTNLFPNNLLFSMSLRAILLLGLFCLAKQKIQAQADPNFTIYKETEGMYILHALPGRDGRIWLGTISGLSGYSGYEFKKYFNRPGDSLAVNETVTAIHEDADGQIWLGAENGRLFRFNIGTGKIREYNYKKWLKASDLEKSMIISSILPDSKGQLLIGVNSDAPLSKSLFTYDIKKDILTPLAIPDSIVPGSIYFSRSMKKGGSIIIGMDNYIFFLDKENRFSKFYPNSYLQDKLSHSTSGELAFDEMDQLWVVSDDASLEVYNSLDKAPVRSYSFQYLLPKQKNRPFFSSMIFDKSGNIWIGMDKGVISFDRKTEKFKRYILPKDNKGKDYEVNAMRFDSFNNLWIGTHNGLIKYENKPLFISYNASGRDTALTIDGFLNRPIQTREGTLLFTSYVTPESQFINELNIQSGKIVRNPIEMILPKGSTLTTYWETGVDTFTFGTDKGLYQYDRKNRTAKKISLPGIPNAHPGLLPVYKDARGNEWVGSLNYLYRRLKGEEYYKAIDLSKVAGGDDKSNMVMPVEAKSVDLWLKTGNGLFSYDYDTDSIIRHGYDKKAGDVFIGKGAYCVWEEDSSGVVWVGIEQGGLNRYDLKTKKIKTYTIDDGLSTMNVASMLYDESHHALWLGTTDGITRFDFKTEQFTNFSGEDGVNGRFFFNALKSKEGQFFFSGEGLIQFNPKEFTTGDDPPLISFADFKIANKSIRPELEDYIPGGFRNQASMVLKSNQNNISIEYLGVHYSNPTKNKFAYILENYEDNWTDAGNRQAAYYTNLPPGKYTFRVKAANSHGIWSREDVSLSIEINPPWWRTNVAYVFYLLGFAGIASIANQYFKQRVLKKERERTQLKELEQAKEIEKAYKELESSHQALKATQSQLIQSEKMASLGELTAGIAHEIQNPLNFVNNFSAVNAELIEEMKTEIMNGNTDAVLSLANDISKNETKIVQHGKRAENIVKGMLQHSRKSAGTKEPTDINVLAEEFLKLSYHGLRAKDKSASEGRKGFNAELIIHLDPTLPLVPVIPQDMGRVLLNLFNNAFYAVSKMAEDVSENTADQEKGPYSPAVSLTTRNLGNKIEIKIRDNGGGIPHPIIEKIFQPFFTTKPSGQGTGLGLSLAYDIIQAHGGSIRLETKHNLEAEPNLESGTEFIIELPISRQ